MSPPKGTALALRSGLRPPFLTIVPQSQGENALAISIAGEVIGPRRYWWLESTRRRLSCARSATRPRSPTSDTRAELAGMNKEVRKMTTEELMPLALVHTGRAASRSGGLFKVRLLARQRPGLTDRIQPTVEITGRAETERRKPRGRLKDLIIQEVA